MNFCFFENTILKLHVESVKMAQQVKKLATNLSSVPRAQWKERPDYPTFFSDFYV